MGLVTQRTVFTDRWVVEQHRSAVLSMAAGAQFISCIANQLPARYTCMWIVTIGADHCGRADRVGSSYGVSRWFTCIGLLLLVTAEACLVLFRAQ